jgi:hypothetical protein
MSSALGTPNLSPFANQFGWGILLVNFLPGLVGTGLYFYNISPGAIAQFIAAPNQLLPIGLYLIFAVLIGVFFEEIGSIIEVYVFDHDVDTTYSRVTKADETQSAIESGGVDDVWYSYLVLQIPESVPARSFIRSRVLRYKFMLAMMPALISIFLAAFVQFNKSGCDVVNVIAVGIAALMFVVFWKNSRNVARSLHELRNALLKTYGKKHEASEKKQA